MRTHKIGKKKGISLCSECLFVATTLIKKLNICFAGGVINLINKQMHGGGKTGIFGFSVLAFIPVCKFSVFKHLIFVKTPMGFRIWYSCGFRLSLFAFRFLLHMSGNYNRPQFHPST